MDFIKFKEYEPLYIIGHKKPDVDSVVSTIILSNIFKSNGIECYPCFLDTEYEIDEYNLGVLKDCTDLNMTIIKNDNTLNYVLVDHNDPIQSIGFGKRIIWGMDHHEDAKILSNIMLDNTCSCSLFIYKYFKEIYNFSNEEKFMIYMASLADSLFFKGSRFNEKDKVLIDELGFDFDTNMMFKKYFIPTDLSNGIENLFLDISKKYVYHNITFSSIVVKTFNEFDYLKKDFRKKISNSPNFLGIWIDLDKEISYAYFNLNGGVKEFIYDYIASRAATVIPDVYKYIDSIIEDN